VIVPTPGEDAGDFLIAAFLHPTSSPFFFPLVSLPPPGACTLYNVDGNLALTTALPGIASAGKWLDAGTPTVAGAPAIAAQSTAIAPFYDVVLGGDDPTVYTNPSVFTPPNPVNISMSGGADVGAFNISVPTSGSLTWTNRDSIQTVDHTQPLNVNWTSSNLAGATILIGGGNVDTRNNASAMFLRTAKASDGTYTVSPLAMANIPATRATETQAYGNVFLYAEPFGSPISLSAPGIDAGFALFGMQFLKSVTWK
jgi:hypothetical protein